MKKSNYKVVGVMSGTSLDGIDLAECVFEVAHDGKWSCSIGVAETISYDDVWKRTLAEGIHFSKGRLNALNEKYTEYLAEVIVEFIERHQVTGIDAICSHGHTILHRPKLGYTLQIGNLPNISSLVKKPVVCNFRVQDVALGGQGAPLVPIGDMLLFQEYDYCLNLGGFANVSFQNESERIAYDICPANIVLNRYAEKLGLLYDEGGEIAKRGDVHRDVLDKLNALEYYSQLAPKSLGLEWVQEFVFPIFDGSTISEEDKIATFTEHIAVQLSKEFQQGASVLVTGGGAYNYYLIERLKRHNKLIVHIPDAKLLEFKEALIFGFLGVLRLRGEVNCLASVTGAKDNHSGGFIYLPS